MTNHCPGNAKTCARDARVNVGSLLESVADKLLENVGNASTATGWNRKSASLPKALCRFRKQCKRAFRAPDVPGQNHESPMLTRGSAQRNYSGKKRREKLTKTFLWKAEDSNRETI
jgi:hypothetical protein